jgi:CheY-like chemotaxis protein
MIAAQMASRSDSVTVASACKNVLLVDDEADMREIASVILTSASAAVHQAASATEALASLKRRSRVPRAEETVETGPCVRAAREMYRDSPRTLPNCQRLTAMSERPKLAT